jgi:hypothetical protein
MSRSASGASQPENHRTADRLVSLESNPLCAGSVALHLHVSEYQMVCQHISPLI